MKLNLKMIAVAAALAAAGSAHADLTGYNTGNGSFSLYAFNTVTRAYYIRDLGLLMNSFLPNSVTTLAGDGGVTGTVTPEGGFSLNSSDAGFSAWLAGQTSTDIRWAAVAGDSLSSAAAGVSRVISTSTVVNPFLSNGGVTNATGGPNLGNLAALFGTNPGTVTTATSGMPVWADTNGLVGANTLATLDTGVGLYYFARTAATGATATQAATTRYGNSANFAVVSLASNGDFSYTLAPAAAVPLPAPIWLMGAGLAAIGAIVRRRKASAQA
jgi:hypothetical protein